MIIQRAGLDDRCASVGGTGPTAMMRASTDQDGIEAMARIIPEGWREVQALGAAQREIETLAQLWAGLPDGYTVYHGVHWTRVNEGFALTGEIDFAIVGPTGKLLLVEQKSGFLSETPEGLYKVYGQKEKSIAFQIGRSMDALHKRLGKFCPEAGFHLDSLLYCPDYTIRQPGSAGIDPARIVDAARRDTLISIIKAILPAEGPIHPKIDRLHRFLADQLDLVPDVGAIAGQARTLYTRLSGGLAEWARRIECEPFRLRVIGSAGSGKTQLALAAFGDALAAGRRPLYVCYNRPLADHFARIAPGGEVATYHQLADRIARSTGNAPDFSQAGAFARLEAFFDAYAPDERWHFDEVIVDEGQDFQNAWKDNVLRLLRPTGRAWWLEDPLQNLYGRPPIELPGWVTVRVAANYRSPQDILANLNRLLPESGRVAAASPLTGSQVDLETYADAAGLVDRTKAAIHECIKTGFTRDMIAVVTYRGREHSQLTPYDKLGAYPLKTFTGRYDLFGNAVLSDGDILIDSVYRFKGQAAPCVIFTEIDFETLDDLALRKLFVGMTRATMKLTLVVSERAATTLLARLADDAD